MKIYKANNEDGFLELDEISLFVNQHELIDLKMLVEKALKEYKSQHSDHVHLRGGDDVVTNDNPDIIIAFNRDS